MFGAIPGPCKSHSAVLLNKDRILVLKWDSAPDDCTWFLEVCTLPGAFVEIFLLNSFMNAMLKSD